MSDQHQDREPRRLGTFDIASVVAGGIIGVGIFITPAHVAHAVNGPGEVLFAWCLGGGLALVGAMVFAELACRIPGHGGLFRYVLAAFGPLPAFLYGWANWLVIQAGTIAVIGLVFVYHADLMLTGRETVSGSTQTVGAVVAITAFTFINVLGLRVGRGVQNALTVIKLSAVFALVAIALSAIGSAEVETEAPGHREAEGSSWFVRIAGAMLPVMFSFGGVQHGGFVAGAAKRPQRDVSLGILTGVGVVVVAYLAINVSFLALLGYEGMAASDAVGTDAARAALGAVGERALAGAVCVSALGIMNTQLLAPPYVLHAMAREGLFLRSCRDLHARFGSPVVAVAVQGGMAVLLLLSLGFVSGGTDQIRFLLKGVVYVDWLFFALCGVALLKLQRHQPREGVGFVAPLGPFFPFVFAVVGSAIAVGAFVASPWPSLVGTVVCAVGVPVGIGVVRRFRQPVG